ncbi:D-2-hydroxyacid dehydrogenase [Leeia sp. TBRC 13508]|uniref:D-2-hydroxyacid dehydrogenase n=1 Tax=Leeia speluncae TaxID=2884804 RepID=A0ABS8D6E8_9NEIS|nr:D-2-hydroxyacid dehydrogenase [Leeia speluncae]MCB6183789.1 D-2-hydroxyacid dehydrogenase [Leeia speluncae]
MHKVVFLDQGSLPVPLPTIPYEVELITYDKTSSDEIVERLTGATVAILNKVKMTSEILAQLPDLKLIAVAATGTDNVDVAWCRANGVYVSNIRGYALQTVPEHALALILALRRALPLWQQRLSEGTWQTADHFCMFDQPIFDIAGSTLGIIGRGELGKALAAKAEALGMNVVYAERKGETTIRNGLMSFEDVLKQSDVISLHCPLTAETKHLISNDELAMMKSSAILINTARGGLVDAEALISALQQGKIGGAGIDVLPEEPPRKGHPLINVQLPNLIVTPHVAWSSQQAMNGLAKQLVGNIEAFFNGTPRNTVK